MSEETWYKMLAVSFALHILLVASFSIPFKSTKRKIDLSSSYSVNLVGGVGDAGGATQAKTIPGKPVPAVKEQKSIPAKNKPIPIKKEDLVSLSKKKVPEKTGTTEEERDQLQKKIQNLKKKTEYFDVAKAARSGSATSGGISGSGGLSLSGEGRGDPIDPLLQKYYMDVVEKVKSAWTTSMVAGFKKNLKTVIVIRIKKNGMIMDYDIEKPSGDRILDESVRRAILKAEPFPPIPTTLNQDVLDVGFTFSPGDL